MLVCDDEIREAIMTTQDAKQIKKIAQEKGMLTLRDAAFQKVLLGETSIEEAIRTTQTDDISGEEEA